MASYGRLKVAEPVKGSGLMSLNAQVVAGPRDGVLVRDQRQKHLGPWSLGLLARWLSRRVTILALAGHFLIIAKLEDHDIRVPILRMGRVVAIARYIRILFITTTNRHDLPRTALLAPLLDQVNCAGKTADE